MATKRRVWRGLRRGRLTKLQRTLGSLVAYDEKESARALADPSYNPVIFAPTTDVQDAISLLQSVIAADLAATA